MSRWPKFAVAAGAAGVGVGALVAVRHYRGAAGGHAVEGGILIDDAGGYDRFTTLLLSGFYRSVARNVADNAPRGARILEIGCGPGRLSILLARDHGLDVTGLDLDPAMVERATANAEAIDAEMRPSFAVGDVAALPFADGSFDVVVSTLSMHHWDDPVAGLTDVARVLRPEGRALIWDIRPGTLPFHAGLASPLERVQGSPLRVVDAGPWHWPWRFSLAERIELARDPEAEAIAVG